MVRPFTYLKKERKTMNKKEFVEKVCDVVALKLGTGYTVKAEEIKKNNNVPRSAILITAPESRFSPCIYMESFYKDYKNGNSIDAVADEVIEIYHKGTPENKLNLDFFRYFDKVKDNICYRIIRKSSNKELLEKIPYINLMDLAVVFYYSLYDDQIGNAMITIHNEHIRMWDVTALDLFKLAKVNTPRLMPYKFMNINDALKSMSGVEEGETAPEVPIKVLTNVNNVNGAACILYPEALKEITDEYGDNFYIIFSSIHEALILPDDGVNTGYIKWMISMINNTELEPEEILSDNLYRYNSGTTEIVSA